MITKARLLTRKLARAFKPDSRLAGVMGAAEFERVFLRERELADRHEHCFSMLVFVHGKSQDRRAADAALARLLADRLRSVDVVGHLDEFHLAALLAFTDGEGAGQVSDDIIHRLARAGFDFNCRTFTYPSSRGGIKGKPSSKGREEQRGHKVDGELLSARTSKPEEQVGSPASDHAAAVSARATSYLPSEYLELSHVRDSLGKRQSFDLEPLLHEKLSFLRRGFDILVSGLALIALAPLLALIAVLVKLSSRGPVIYVQQRAGLGGKPFPFYKFRSMYVDAEQRQAELAEHNEKDGPIFKMKNDPRITPVGKWLRRWSLDELPQLFNVLIGDMTVIGPRPPKLNEVAEYRTWHRRRLTRRGGLTCIWQVSGRSEVGFEDWMRMDVRYIKRRNPALDLSILARTLRAVVSARGAY